MQRTYKTLNKPKWPWPYVQKYVYPRSEPDSKGKQHWDQFWVGHTHTHPYDHICGQPCTRCKDDFEKGVKFFENESDALQALIDDAPEMSDYVNVIPCFYVEGYYTLEWSKDA